MAIKRFNTSHHVDSEDIDDDIAEAIEAADGLKDFKTWYNAAIAKTTDPFVSLESGDYYLQAGFTLSKYLRISGGIKFTLTGAAASYEPTITGSGEYVLHAFSGTNDVTFRNIKFNNNASNGVEGRCFFKTYTSTGSYRFEGCQFHKDGIDLTNNMMHISGYASYVSFNNCRFHTSQNNQFTAMIYIAQAGGDVIFKECTIQNGGDYGTFYLTTGCHLSSFQFINSSSYLSWPDSSNAGRRFLVSN
jgi:hypothetical protein